MNFGHYLERRVDEIYLRLFVRVASPMEHRLSLAIFTRSGSHNEI